MTVNARTRDSLRRILPTLLATRLEERNPQFGKTVFMKLTYLLQEVYKLPLGYRFTLYTYGPYASEVLSDLDRSDLRGGVEVTYEEDELGFRIKAGPRAEHILAEYAEIASPYETDIYDLVGKFGHLRAKDLELRTTVVYVWGMTGAPDETSIDDVANLVKELKPHFQDSEIQAAIRDLFSKRTIAIE